MILVGNLNHLLSYMELDTLTNFNSPYPNCNTLFPSKKCGIKSFSPAQKFQQNQAKTKDITFLCQCTSPLIPGATPEMLLGRLSIDAMVTWLENLIECIQKSRTPSFTMISVYKPLLSCLSLKKLQASVHYQAV